MMKNPPIPSSRRVVAPTGCWCVLQDKTGDDPGSNLRASSVQEQPGGRVCSAGTQRLDRRLQGIRYPNPYTATAIQVLPGHTSRFHWHHAAGWTMGWPCGLRCCQDYQYRLYVVSGVSSVLWICTYNLHTHRIVDFYWA